MWGISKSERVWVQCPTPATQSHQQCTLSHACHAKEAETQATPGRTSTPWQCTLSHACHTKEAETQGTRRAYIRPLGSAHCPTPATQKRRRPKRRQGVHPIPWQCTLPHTCHATEAATQGTPGRTSDPLAVHIVPRLPRKRGGDPRDARAYIRPLAGHIVPRLPRKRSGDPRDARAYIRPLGSAHCATPATQRTRRPKGRQGAHPTPWQCTLSHACHAKEAEIQGTPGRTSDPLAVHIVPRLPRKRGGDPGDARAYIRPLGNAYCPTPATQKRRRPKGRQGVHPTPLQCTLCHAKEAEIQGRPGRTSDPLALHIAPRLPRKRGGDPRDARAYIRPLGSAHCATPATQKRRRPKGRHCPTPATQKRRRPKRRQGVHPTPWQCTLSHACHAKEAETQGTPGRTSDPLAVPRKRGGDPRDARAYIRPLGSAHCPTPATQKKRRPKGRQGVHPTPWQCTLSHACHAKEVETQGTPGRTSDPLAVHIVPRLPRKRGGDPRDARAYSRPLGSAHCATPAMQKKRRPRGRQGVHPTPWQWTDIVPRLPHKRGGDPRDARAYIRPLGSAHCATPAMQKKRRARGCQGVHPTPWQWTLSHACHAKEAATQGTPGRTSDPLAVHIVPRLPRKRGGDPSDARAYIRPLGSAHCPTPATQKRRRPKGRQGVHPTPWQCTLCHACHAKEVSEWVSVCVSEWVSGEWVSEWEREIELVSERVSEWVCGEQHHCHLFCWKEHEPSQQPAKAPFTAQGTTSTNWTGEPFGLLSQREFVTRASCTFESRCPGDGVPLNLTLWQGKLHAGGSTMFHTFFSHRMSCGNQQSARLGCDGPNYHYLISRWASAPAAWTKQI